MLFSGAFLAAPAVYAKNDGAVGHGTGHDSAQHSAAQSSGTSNDANGDASIGATPTAPPAASTPSTGGNSQGGCDDLSASVSTGIGHCHDGGSGSADRSGDAHPSLGWQSLLPGSIQ
ncbi:hypothetical protein LF63_0102860 [Oleiagrimonas soli]|uniref:Uncharacterized protein n=1 Tax=Oleiagrimonas soli TaxID=1543381 RepID=A0A099D0R1_9GAMM|nr:hypothetical protein LF63_0102860 [Oleiagrimonas soli]